MPLTGTPSIVSYPGILDPIGCDVMRSNGTTPDVLRVRFAMQPGAPVPAGPLVIGYGARTITILDCKLDNVRILRSDRAGTTLEATILDGRWKWQWGGISGEYNLIDPRGNVIKRTERTPQQLATMLLRAMFGLPEEDAPPTRRAGSRRRAEQAKSNAKALPFDVSKLPNDSRPRVQWDEAVPAHALNQLCESLGCLVSYKWNNRVVLERVGEGALLPDNDDVKELSITLDPKEVPDEFVVVTPPERWEVAIPVEAVGLDTDGTLKSPWKLSYCPTTNHPQDATIKLGWANGTGVLNDETHLALAEESVYRWFRLQPKRVWVAEPHDIDFVAAAHDPLFSKKMAGDQGWNLDLPGFGLVDNLWQILPCEAGLVQFEFDAGRDDYVGRPPKMFGLFAAQILGSASPTDNNFDPTLADLDEEQHALPKEVTWRVDRSRGLVQLSTPVWRWGTRTADNDGNPTLIPQLFPILFLRTTVSAKDPRSGGWTRYYRRRRIGNYGTAAKRIFREDLQLSTVVTYDYDGNFRPTPKRKGGLGNDDETVVGIVDNLARVNAAADRQLDATIRQYAGTVPGLATYRGLQFIEPDGAIRQVHIRIGDGQHTLTSASRNDEAIGFDETLTAKQRIDWLYEQFQKRDQQQPAAQAGAQRRLRQGQ